MKICSNELSANDVQPLMSYQYSNPHKNAGIWGEEKSELIPELHRMTFSESSDILRRPDKFEKISHFVLTLLSNFKLKFCGLLTIFILELICTTRDRLKFVAGFHSCRHVSLKTPVYMYVGTTYVCAMYVSMKL